MEHFDDIDRALFALPLEEAPQGLRDSILAITVYAPQPERARVGLFENVGIGIALALLVSFTWAVIVHPAFAATVSGALTIFAQGLAQPWTLLSLAMGFSAIFLVSLLPLEPVRIRVRTGRT